MKRIETLPVAVFVLLFSAVAAFGAAPSRAEKTVVTPIPGVWWEGTVQMSMAGMGRMMPPTTDKFCRPNASGWDEPPPMGHDSDCRLTEKSVSGNTLTWKMACTKPQPATGSGEMTFTPTDYNGTMSMTLAEGSMTIKMSGHKVGGDCDAAAPLRESKRAEQAVVDMKKENCRQMAAEMNVSAFSGPYTICTDPADKEDLCRRLGTLEGYRKLAGNNIRAECGPEGPTPAVKQAAEFCGKDPASLRPPLCQEVARTVSDYEFLAACCPEEGKALAQQECAGREYTALAGTKYASFCATYAAGAMAKDPAATTAAEQPKDSPMKKGKKMIKGLFGK